jgi:release factor glutamine methyltransferase
VSAPAAQEIWTVLGLLRWTTQHFKARGLDSPRLDAECLLAHALGTDRLRLYLDFDKPVEAEERARFRELVRRRGSDRVPVSILTGRREFWSLPLRVTADVLTPRPETEVLVALALERFGRERAFKAVDVGTGSGAIALALAHERPRATVVASDVSPAALALARENAEALGLAERVRFALGPLFEPVADERFDLVASNPPYLAEREAATLPPELAFEPRSALFAGPEGTELLEALVAAAPRRLSPGGSLLLEISPEQSAQVEGFCRAAGLRDVRSHLDLARRPRVVSARAPGEEAPWTAS